MPLNKPKLIADIKIAFDKSHKMKSPKEGLMTLSIELAAAIDAYVRSGEVQTNTTGAGVVAPGILVVTAGSAAAQTGATTVTGTSVTIGTGVGKVV